MITKLTSLQERQLTQHYDEWIKIGRSCDPMDKEASVEVMTYFYEKINKPKPIFIFCQSPFQAIIYYNILKNIGENIGENIEENLAVNLRKNLGRNLKQNLGRNLKQNLWGNLWENLEQNLEQNLNENLWENLWQNLEQNLDENLRENLGGNLWGNLWQNLRQNLGQNLGENLGQNLGRNLRQNLEQNLRENLRENLWGNLCENLGKNLRQNLWENLEENLNKIKIDIPSTYIRGSFDGYFPGYYSYMNKYLGIKYDKNDIEILRAWDKLSKSCGLVYTFKNFCFICDRPKIMKLNDNGELHNENGPCMEFRDGYKFYSINGVKLPNWVFNDPDRLSVKSIDNEANIEVRRILIERFGIDKYLQEKNAKVIDFEVGPEITRGLMKINNKEVYLCGHDGSTDRVYYMSVNPKSTTCREAHESISFLDESLCVGQG